MGKRYFNQMVSKKAGISIFRGYKLDFQLKIIKREKEAYYILRKDVDPSRI